MASTEKGLYRPEFEHDACGVGVVANVNGVRSHDIVVKGIEVLTNLEHRGAECCDPDTGDGGGMLVQMPGPFFRKEASRLGIDLPNEGDYAVGMVFLPQPDDERARCERIIEDVTAQEGQRFLGWRDVPVDVSQIGWLARERLPVIRQFFVGRGDATPAEGFERKLYVLRKVVDARADQQDMPSREEFYTCSLSTNRIVYKGLLKASQISAFYRDLRDEDFVSAFAMVHSRFSTNTLGEWRLAHPYRMVVHNGEINTLRGNVNFMRAREAMFESPLFDEDIDKLRPVIRPGQSDTASLDNALELLYHTGRSLPHAMLMLIPEAWGDHIPMPQEKRDFYEYHANLMEPWDGPALVCFTDGHHIGAILDRNGLRPFRYLVTKDELLVMSSETGVLPNIPPEDVRFKARLDPGRMFYVDFEEGRIVGDEEIKFGLAGQQPYGKWLREQVVDIHDLPEPRAVHRPDFESLVERQRAFGYTLEDLQMIMEPMGVNSAEPIGSMGNDAALAILSDRPYPLFNYFKQLFAQVTNPPLDAIREELVTSVVTFIGSEQNLFSETPLHCQQLQLKEPVLKNEDLERIRNLDQPGVRTKQISILCDVRDGKGALASAMERIRAEASRAIRDGYTILLLSDRGVDEYHVPIPSLLAVSGIHHHLIREGTRTKAGIVLESGEPREVHHFATLIGYGAGAINPYLALETVADLVRRNRIDSGMDVEKAQKNFVKALVKGVVKVMSKMGISTVQSYRGAQVFEAVGLSQELVDEYFTWTVTRIGGLTIDTLEEEVLRRHRAAYPERPLDGRLDLENPGFYYWRSNGEYHMWNPDTVAKLQHATKLNSRKLYREFAELSDEEDRRHATIRGLLRFKPAERPLSLDEVEPAEEIMKRFATGAISLGSISREAHETMAIAMNRVGGRSNTGEGGEDPARYTPDPNGDSRNSAIKQVASGRFGVTTNYLVNALDLQIKMAQGSKPGEGGHLPGLKVDHYIGWVRNTTPGVELISPPPHHDIYSIEDLAQLIHDLKNGNPRARIHVKLVSAAGVGTIAAGVSKGKADVVLISGDSGGTGASPESSIKHAGLPWELGLAETQQVLVANDLRSRIVVQTDGQLKTGRDVAVAALLGAEEFGFATSALITMGCIYLRKCHLNLCSVGIATQDPELRKKFAGQPEYVVNYFQFVAEQLREIMAETGFRTVDEMIGRVDRLDWERPIEHWKAKGLDLNGLLFSAEHPEDVGIYHYQEQDHKLQYALDNELIRQCRPALERGEPVQVETPIQNANRTVGGMLSGEVAKRYGEDGLPEDTIRVKFTGSAGQSFGAWLARGVSFTIEGDTNDYMGKGLNGGRIVVYPNAKATFVPEDNIVVGNVLLYGATRGEAFIRGRGGERFGVRNSGANAVIEGVGDHGCEYMTGGRVVVIGSTGRNFAAGMSGGVAYVLDEEGVFPGKCNTGMVELGPLEEESDLATVRLLLEKHREHTGSTRAQRILDNWDAMVDRFVRVMPVAYKRVLELEQEKQQTEATVVSHG